MSDHNSTVPAAQFRKLSEPGTAQSKPPYNRFRTAIDILDAGNMRAIAREFVKVVDAAADELQATTAVWSDPAVVLLVTKLSELSGAHRPDAFSKAYAEAQQRCST